MAGKNHEIIKVYNKDIPFSLMVESDVNANEQDGATFTRLKEEMSSDGFVLELPVLRELPPDEDGIVKYGIISGHHRIRAWEALGHETCPCRVFLTRDDVSDEWLFNKVNNMNTITGKPTLKRMKGIIRNKELDPTQLDVFKYPTLNLMPNMDKVIGKSDQVKRRSDIRNMARPIAEKVAVTLLDDMDAMVLAFRVKDKCVAVITLDLPATEARRSVSLLTPYLEAAVDAWYDGDEGTKDAFESVANDEETFDGKKAETDSS